MDDQAQPQADKVYVEILNRSDGVQLINEHAGLPKPVSPGARRVFHVPQSELNSLKVRHLAGVLHVTASTQEAYVAQNGPAVGPTSAVSPEANDWLNDPAFKAGPDHVQSIRMAGAGAPTTDDPDLASRMSSSAAALSAGLPANFVLPENMEDADLKALIKDRTGEAVRGNPSHATLVARAYTAMGLNADGSRSDGDGSAASPPAPGDSPQGDGKGNVKVEGNGADEAAAAYKAATEAGFPGTMEEWIAAGRPAPAGSSEPV